MTKKNCWEVMNCGRQAGGEKADELGVCAASLPNIYDGINNGTHGGRFCWSVVGTMCGKKASGTNACKISGCMHCIFLKKVYDEEGSKFIFDPKKIKKSKTKSIK